MAFEDPKLLNSYPPGSWPAKDDEGNRFSVTINPLRGVAARPRNKSLITKPSPHPGAPVIVLSGAVSAIVEHVLLGTDDELAVKSFLLGYLPYLSPPELFKTASDLIDARVKHERGGKLPPVAVRRMLTFFCEWLDTYGSRDFKKKSLTTQVLNYCSTHLSSEDANKLKLRYIKVIRKNSVQVDLGKMNSPTVTPSTNTPAPRDFNLEDLTPSVLADYLTFIEASMYRSMQPWEFLKQAWQHEEKQTRAPNLSALIGRFNQVSNWVASQVIQAAASAGRGAHVISHLIETAKRLYDMNNYNTLMEILSGLNNINVSRLRALWSEVPARDKETFERLDGAMAPQANFRNYRELVKAKRLLGEFVFPYLAVHLRDLTFVNEANPDVTPNKFLNFEKLVLQGTTIMELMALKSPAPALVCEDAALLAWLRQMRALGEEEIREASLRMVPLKNVPVDGGGDAPLNLSSSTHQQWGPSALIRTVEVKQLASWTAEDIEAWLARNSSKSAADCLMKQLRNGPQLLHLTEENLVSLGVPKESLSPLLAALKQLREQNPDMRVELSSLLQREPHAWSVLDVAQWLVTIGLGALRQIFIFHLVDGPSLFQLTDSLLVDMQVRDPVHRSRLLHKVALLQERSPSALNDDDDEDDDSGDDLAASNASIGGGGGGSSATGGSNNSDSSEADKKTTFVCYYEDTKAELRLVRSTYKRFKRAVRKNFGGAHLRIKYQDDEGGLCAIKSDEDLAQAIQQQQRNNKAGHVNLYLFAKRRKRLVFTGGARSDSPVAFLRSNSIGTGSVRVRSRSGSSVGLPHFRDRAPSSSSLTSASADPLTPSSVAETAATADTASNKGV